jgi:tetratricopeptide (TPR) repeat protein
LEFSAPKAQFFDQSLMMNLKGLEQFKSRPQTVVPDYDSATTEDAAFYHASASMWSFQRQRGKAVAALERAVSMDPLSSEAWVQLGELYAQSRAYLKAEEALTQAVEFAPHARHAYRVLARLHWQQRQLELARRFYHQAASLQVPDSAFAEELGNCWREDNQMAAAEYYRSAISQGGGGRKILVANFASALAALKFWTDAQQVLAFAMREFPTEAVFPLRLGEIFLEQGRMLDAEPFFHQVLTIAPETAQAYYGLGRIAFSQGRVEQAVRYLKSGLLYDPYHREALALLQQIQRQQT